MKKKIGLFLILLLLPFCNKVKAGGSFNGTGNPISYNSSWGAYCDARFCPWGNGDKFIGAKISLWYINDGNYYEVRTIKGKVIEPVYMVSEPISSTSFNNVRVVNDLKAFIGNRTTAYPKMSEYFSKKFGTTGNTNGCAPIYDKNVKKKYFKEVFGVAMEDVNFEYQSEEVSCGNNKAEKGYRIIIEPLMRVSTTTVGATAKYYFLTVKEIAQEGLTPNIIRSGGGYVWNASSFTFKDMAQAFVTKVTDVGITAYTSSQCSSFGASPPAGAMYKPLGAAYIADKKTGCGYNIIDFTDIIEPPVCYGQTINSPKIECTNSDKNNVANYSETYSSLTSCDNIKEEDRKKYSENGKLMAQSGTCGIYCKETAKVSLPGNITDSKLRGSYFAWPSVPGTNGLYDMSMQITLSCKIEDINGENELKTTAVLECPSGYDEYDSNTCVSKQTYPTTGCPSGFQKKDNTCIKYHCSFNSSTGYINGKLSSDQKTCTVQLANQYECLEKNSKLDSVNKKCLMNATDNYVCESGWNESDAGGKHCERKASKTYDYECKDGGSLSNTTCIKNTTKVFSKYYCSRGELNGTKCKYYLPNRGSSCPSGWKRISEWNCEKNAEIEYKDACPDSSWKMVGSSTGTYTCQKPATKSTTKYHYVCPSGSQQSSIDKSICIKQGKTEKVCPTGWNKSYYAGIHCEQAATLKTKNVSSQIMYSSFVCGNGMIESGNQCHTSTKKVTTGYECPYGYDLVGIKCIKICNKDVLINSVQSQLNNANMEAKLIGGTNKKVDSKLIETKGTNDYNNSKLIFTRKAYFILKDNINRYQNRETNEVFSIYNSAYFDRKQGVISTSINDTMIENNTVKKYPLEISDIKLGTKGQFGQKKYTCHYTLTDITDCICPEGTKNAGDDANEIYLNACKEKSNETCSELQQLVCDTNKVEKAGCDNQYYCISSLDSQVKINLDSCIRQIQSTKKYSITEALNYCKTNTPECNIENGRRYCENIKTKEVIDITECLKNDSLVSCYKQNGCIYDICDSGKCCTGKCSWKYFNTNETIYGIQNCDNNGKSNQSCGFEVYCKKTGKDISQSMMGCIENKLNTKDFLNNYNVTITQQQLDNAVKACEKSICSSSFKVVYRVIDLNNPFPGKNRNGKNNNFSLTDIKSRTPGSNWNSTTVVKNKILNARGAKGYDLYNKSPIVTIKLQPSTIKNIRKYNDTTQYEDFNLKCLNDSKTAGCISYFLHNNKTVEGLDIKWNSKCSNLNASSSLDTFNNCYNSKD